MIKKNIVKALEDDSNASERKQDHIELAFRSQVTAHEVDDRFYYEPILSAHPPKPSDLSISFLGKDMKVPIWVSSMTGGTAYAKKINHHLARVCRDFGIGMGLGSCRSLLYSDEYFVDFNIRPIMGHQVPFFANLGIAQVEELIYKGELYRIEKMLERLQADGLIIHVNPMQEWLQPEGDRIKVPPLETIASCLEKISYPMIVKEVGQGMGYESLKALFQLPLAAIDFAASGGTNFALLELHRGNPVQQKAFAPLAYIGHTAEEMVNMCNRVIVELGERLACKQVIISGGIKHFLDGYYLMNKLTLACIYGQASAFLHYARKDDYLGLYDYVQAQVDGLALAKAYLKVKE